MKRIVLYLAVAIFILAGCNKDNPPIEYENQTVTGIWELRQVTGGYTKNYAPGNGSTLELNGDDYTTTDSTWSFFMNGGHHKKGKYKIISDGTVTDNVGLVFPAGQFTHRLLLDGDNASQKIFIDVNGSTLRIASGFFPTDGGSIVTFERK